MITHWGRTTIGITFSASNERYTKNSAIDDIKKNSLHKATSIKALSLCVCLFSCKVPATHYHEVIDQTRAFDTSKCLRRLSHQLASAAKTRAFPPLQKKAVSNEGTRTKAVMIPGVVYYEGKHLILNMRVAVRGSIEPLSQHGHVLNWKIPSQHF